MTQFSSEESSDGSYEYIDETEEETDEEVSGETEEESDEETGDETESEYTDTSEYEYHTTLSGDFKDVEAFRSLRMICSLLCDI